MNKQGYLHSNSDTYVEEFLYDLLEDPYEKRNLVRDSSYKEVRKELSQRLIERMLKVGEVEPRIVPNGFWQIFSAKLKLFVAIIFYPLKGA